MPRFNSATLCKDSTSTSGAKRPLSGSRGVASLFTGKAGVSHRRTRLYIEKENIEYLSLLCELFGEARNKQQRENVLREIHTTAKSIGVKLPTVLLVPGLPRVVGKNAIYRDGTVRPLKQVVRTREGSASVSLRKSDRGAGKP